MHPSIDRFMARGAHYRPFLDAVCAALDAPVASDGGGDADVRPDAERLPFFMQQTSVGLVRALRSVTLAHDAYIHPLIGLATMCGVPRLCEQLATARFFLPLPVQGSRLEIDSALGVFFSLGVGPEDVRHVLSVFRVCVDRVRYQGRSF